MLGDATMTPGIVMLCFFAKLSHCTAVVRVVYALLRCICICILQNCAAHRCV